MAVEPTDELTDGPTDDLVAVRRRRRRLYVGVPIAIVLLAVAVVGGAYLLRSHPGARSVDSAVSRFRGSSSTTPGPDEFTRPAAGVYEATGHGTESLSVPPDSQSDGASMPVTVEHLDQGCWRWRIDYNVAHWHEYTFCPAGARLLLQAQRNHQSWDLGMTTVTNDGQYTCDPPAPIALENAAPGETAVHHCVGSNSAAAGVSVAEGPAVNVGTETLSIGRVEVRAIHQRRTQTMSGPQTGTIDEDWWFAADTGLPLQVTRQYRLDTSSVIGTITYKEDGTWTLKSLTPRT